MATDRRPDPDERRFGGRRLQRAADQAPSTPRPARLDSYTPPQRRRLIRLLPAIGELRQRTRLSRSTIWRMGAQRGLSGEFSVVVLA